MKKKIGLLVLLAMVVMASVICEEVNTGPNKESGFFNSWIYYTGEMGTSSYKLDWDAFYKRMNEYAKTTRYRYIHVGISTIGPDERSILSFIRIIWSNTPTLGSGNMI